MPSMLTLVNGMAIAALDELFAVDLTALAKMKPEQQSQAMPTVPLQSAGQKRRSSPERRARKRNQIKPICIATPSTLTRLLRSSVCAREGESLPISWLPKEKSSEYGSVILPVSYLCATDNLRSYSPGLGHASE